MSHTPGPWTVSTDGHRGYMRTLAYVPVHTMTDYHELYIVAPEAELSPHPKKHQTVRKDGEDNARLIAAAPDLLAACEELLAMAEITGDEVWEADEKIPVYEYDSSWFTIGVAKRIAAAVRKARGES